MFFFNLIYYYLFCRLKLYLEQFKIGSCVLNSELPAAVRCLSVDQFNRGRYQIIVASDEKALEKPDGGLLAPDEWGKKNKVYPLIYLWVWLLLIWLNNEEGCSCP